MKTLLLTLATIFLSGCVLQSTKPVFNDAQGQLLLGSKTSTYLAYSLEKDSWKKEDDALKLTPQGNHYVYTEKGKTTEITFVQVAREWWMTQFHESDKPAIYVFANVQPDAIYIHPLTCHNLTYNGPAQNTVSFVKDDCFLNPSATLKDFKTFVTASGPRTMKLVLQK